MNKHFVCVVALNIFWLVTISAEIVFDHNYGNEVFKRLSLKFPHQFSIERKNGDEFNITKEDEIGKYLISIFSSKTKSGWIYWGGRHPLKGYEFHDGQCAFYKMLNLEPPREEGIEILLSKRLEANDCENERFWAALIFEICNALQGDEFIKCMEAFKRKEIDQKELSERMMKIEFASGINAQKFQREIWRPFCLKNSLNVRNKNWFFSDGTTYEQWKSKLLETKQGRRYLEVYGMH